MHTIIYDSMTDIYKTNYHYVRRVRELVVSYVYISQNTLPLVPAEFNAYYHIR